MTGILTERLSAELRRLRQDRGWSLDRLAAESGVSRATLSRIENASVSPTAEALAALGAAFGLPVSRLLSRAEGGRAALMPYAEQQEWEDPETGHARRTVSPPAESFVATLHECHLPPGARVTEPAPDQPAAECHLVLLDGAATVTAAAGVYDLTAGDCLRLHLSAPMTIETGERRGARYLLVRV